MDWLAHLFHNDHGELALLASLLAAPAVMRARLRLAWRSLRVRLAAVREFYRTARCDHQGAREYVTHAYHESIGAWALDCPTCGIAWDQTHGPLPGRRGRLAAAWHALPALWWDGGRALPAPGDPGDAAPF